MAYHIRMLFFCVCVLVFTNIILVFFIFSFCMTCFIIYRFYDWFVFIQPPTAAQNMSMDNGQYVA